MGIPKGNVNVFCKNKLVLGSTEHTDILTSWIQSTSLYRRASTAYYIRQDIKEVFNRREDTVSIFVHFQVTYDSKWRCKLPEKLHNLGVIGKMRYWLLQFISQRYNNSQSTYKETRRGLPQATCSSTSISMIYPMS